MDAKTKRKHLNDFKEAAKNIEFAEICIGFLERMPRDPAQRIIKTLKAEQKKYLTKMDYNAAKLGAPYGS